MSRKNLRESFIKEERKKKVLQYYIISHRHWPAILFRLKPVILAGQKWVVWSRFSFRHPTICSRIFPYPFAMLTEMRNITIYITIIYFCSSRRLALRIFARVRSIYPALESVSILKVTMYVLSQLRVVLKNSG